METAEQKEEDPKEILEPIPDSDRVVLDDLPQEVIDDIS